MPIIPPPAITVTTFPVVDIISDALIELRLIRVGETPSTSLNAFMLRKLNMLLDTMNASKDYSSFITGTGVQIAAGKQPVTIGPDMPVDLVMSGTILIDRVTLSDDLSFTGGTIANQYKLDLFTLDSFVDRRWLITTTARPTLVGMIRRTPNIEFYFNTLPDRPYYFNIYCTSQQVSNLAIGDNITFPFTGYRQLITLQLALEASPGLGAAVNNITVQAWQNAKEVVLENNRTEDPPPTRPDSRMPGIQRNGRTIPNTFYYDY